MLRPVASITTGTLMLALLGACTATPSREKCASAAPDRIPRVTALYEQATRQPVHRFRKPVRDQQARARRELQAECDRWLADLQAAALPTALTGQCEAAPVPPSTDVAALRSSLEQLRCAAGQSDPAEIRSAHKEAVTAYQQVQASLGFESFAHN